MSILEEIAIPVLLVTIGFIIRLLVSMQVPMCWDEGVYPLLGASYIKNIATTKFSPEAWNLEFHPPVTMYLHGFGYSLFILLKHLITRGVTYDVESISQLAVKSFRGKRTLLVLRLPSMVMGSLTIVLTYYIGLTLFHDTSVAFIAALFLALTPHFTMWTTYVTLDVGLSFFFSLTIWLLSLSPTHWIYFIGSAITLGLALGSKEPALSLPIVVLVVSMITPILDPIYLIIWTGIGLLVLFISWPLLWSHPIKRLLEHASSVSKMKSRLGAGPFYYVIQLLHSTPVTLLGLYVTGVALGAARLGISYPYLILLLWILVPICLMSLPNVPKRGGVSELVFVFPSLSLMASFGLTTLTEYISLELLITVAIFVILVAEILRFHPFYMQFRNVFGSRKEIPPGWYTEGMDKAIQYIDEHAPKNFTIWIYGPKSTAYYYSTRVNTELSLEEEGLFQMRKDAGFDTSIADSDINPYFKQWKQGDLKFYFPYFHPQNYSKFNLDFFRERNVSFVLILNWAYCDTMDLGNTAIIEQLRDHLKPSYTARIKGSEVCWVYDVR